MQRSEFEIGREFTCGDGTYRCTDIGTRVIVAIRVDRVDRSTMAPGSMTETEVVEGTDAEAQGLFNGPPYSVLEHVFDEYELEACEPA